MSLLGNLTVGILGNASGLSNSFRDAQRQVRGFSDRVQALGRSISSVGDTLTRRLTMPAVAATSALAGITLVKGFGRLVGIDTAKAKLKGLGHDAKSVEAIMKSALESVKGTSYGLDEAATTAANAVAAGIKPGKELTRYLSLTGDAAAIAGSSMSEMGSIINKVQTAQKAYTGELNMLADRGLPIYQWLADEADTTAEKIRDMASDGKISSEMFLKAIESNIGGAAKIMGEESFTASISNIWASVSRIGANFLDAGGQAGGFFSTVKPMLSDFNKSLEVVEGKAAELGVAFGNAFNALIEKVKEVKSWFDDLPPAMQEMILKATAIGSAVAVGIGPALKIIGSLITSFGTFSKVLGFLTSPIGLVIAAIAGLGVAFVALWQSSETFRTNVTEVFNKIRDIAVQIFETVASFIGEKIVQIKQFWDENGSQFLEAVENVFNGIKAVIEFVMPAVLFIVEMVWTAIKQVISGALDVIMGLVKVFSGLFTGDFSQMWEGIKQIFFGAIDLIIGWMTLTFVGGLRTLLTNLAKNSLNLVKGMGEGIVNFFKSFVTTSQNLASSMVNKVLSFFRNLYESASSIFTMLRNFGANIWSSLSQTITSIAQQIWKITAQRFTSMVESIKNIFGTTLKVVNDIWDKVMDFFKGIDLFSVGADIMRGLINGIGSMATAVWEKTKSIAKGIGDTIMGVLGIHSPSRLAIWIMEMFGKGMVIGGANSINSINKMAEDLADAAIPNFSSVNNYTGFTPINASSTGQGMIDGETHSYGDIYVTIDPSNIQEMTNVIDFFNMLNQAARAR